MNIKIQYHGNGTFKISNRTDFLWAERRLVKNRIYNADLKTRRNLRAHNLYWLFLEAVAFHLGESSAAWHDWLKSKFMNPTIIVLKSGVIAELPKSESFKKCTEEEFNKYFSKVQAWFLEQGYDPEVMISEAQGAI